MNRLPGSGRMNCCDNRLCCSFIPGYNLIGSAMVSQKTFRWPVRYLPTSPEPLATPFGAPGCAERSSRCSAPRASRRPPRTASRETSHRRVRMVAIHRHRVEPLLGLGIDHQLAHERARNELHFVRLPQAVQVKSGEYFAPIGQMGEQVSLRQHCARPLYGIEFLADFRLARCECRPTPPTP